MNSHFEYMGEDREVPDAKIYKVEAIHVTTTANKRKFTETELKESARSLSFRPLNRNHEEERQLPFFEEGKMPNCTLDMHFDENKKAVVGRIRVMDNDVNNLIESGKIRNLSIEQIPTRGEECNDILCEQHGIAFIGLALLDEGIIPGDPRAIIKMESMAKNWDTLENLIVSDAQRECHICSDFIQCKNCQHKREDCMSDAIKEIKREHPDWKQDKVIEVALSKCGKSRQDEIWQNYEECWNKYETIHI